MSSWQHFADTINASTQDFPECAIVDLSNLGLIRVSGGDSRTFLQGQLTNDVNQVTAEHAQLSSYCSPKGRMLGSFWIFQRGHDLYLQMPVERLAAILKRLQMFVLRADVTIEDASDSLARLGLSGDCAEALLPFAPKTSGDTITRDALSIVRLPGDLPRFELLGPPDELAGLGTRLRESATPAGVEFWSLLDIRAGVPSVFEETVEAFVPQMANLQLIDGVSFTKGCYTGQEIVARMQYLGKLKRRMYRVKIDAEQRPQRGSEVFSHSSESGQGAGRIVDAARAPDGGFEALAVLQISSAEADDMHLGDADGPLLRQLDLPYSFDAAED